MNLTTQQVVEKYPDLEGLYIPQTGEIVPWGKGHAIVTMSPFGNAILPLMVISLNGGICGPFEVIRQSLMGPYEALTIEQQEEAIRYVNQFNGRFTKLFDQRPDVLLKWNAYREAKRAES